MTSFMLWNFWMTCSYDEDDEEIHVSVLSDTPSDFSFGSDDIRRVLQLLQRGPLVEYIPDNAHNAMVEILNYQQDPQTKSASTLLRKQIGGVWNFFFCHIIYCLSRKMGGHDQSPKYITDLAYAIIAQLNIDFADYFFKEIKDTVHRHH